MSRKKCEIAVRSSYTSLLGLDNCLKMGSVDQDVSFVIMSILSTAHDLKVVSHFAFHLTSMDFV